MKCLIETIYSMLWNAFSTLILIVRVVVVSRKCYAAD